MKNYETFSQVQKKMESATKTLKSHLISHSANFAGFRHCGPISANFAAKLAERVLYVCETVNVKENQRKCLIFHENTEFGAPKIKIIAWLNYSLKQPTCELDFEVGFGITGIFQISKK